MMTHRGFQRNSRASQVGGANVQASVLCLLLRCMATKLNVRRCFGGVLVGAILVLFYLNANVNRQPDVIEETFQTQLPPEEEATHIPTKTTYDPKFLIKTPGCRIPNIDPYNEEILKLPNNTTDISCSQFESLTFADKDYLRINRTAVGVSSGGNLTRCSFQNIRRLEDDDFQYAYDKPVQFSKDTLMTCCEYVRVRCFNKQGKVFYVNFHAFVTSKPNMGQISTQLSDPNVFNVILMAIDSTSRLNSIRKLPKLRKFLQHELGAIEMTGNTRVGVNTFPNVVPLLTGWRYQELKKSDKIRGMNFDRFPMIWKNFSSHGYSTLFGEDGEPSYQTFNYKKNGFRKPPTDLYLRPLSLAIYEEQLAWEKNRGAQVGWVNNRACIGAKFESEFILQWVDDFIDMCASKQTPYFAFPFFSRLSHENANDAALLDDPLTRFFGDLLRKGRLNDTVLLVFGDHGIRFGPVRDSSNGEYEENLPMMFVYLPPRLQRARPDMMAALRTNSERLTTVFDVHQTLHELLALQDARYRKPDVNSRSRSLFGLIPETRTCEEADIEPYCQCVRDNRLSVSYSDESLKRVAQLTIKYMNDQMKSTHGGRCARLKLERITKAEVVAGRRPEDDSLFMFVFETSPGHGRFLAKVYYKFRSTFGTKPRIDSQGQAGERTSVDGAGDAIRPLGDISRINQYGRQSECIDHILHRSWCYCNDKMKENQKT